MSAIRVDLVRHRAPLFMVDIPGNLLRITPHFRGKWRLQRYWERHLNTNDRRIAFLPDGSTAEVEMRIPYERMIWLQAEEWRELHFLRNRLRRNESFVDVGANLGLWTLVAASTVGSGGRVFSFEPNPETFQKLIANVKRNGRATTVKAFPMAVSRNDGVVSFNCVADHNLSAISADLNAPDTISVRTTSLDSVLQGSKVAGIKLDTEGHELLALEGALNTIEQSSPWLIIEFNTTLLPSTRLADWPVYRFLATIGYRAFVNDGARAAEELSDSFSFSGYCNVLFHRNP